MVVAALGHTRQNGLQLMEPMVSDDDQRDERPQGPPRPIDLLRLAVVGRLPQQILATESCLLYVIPIQHDESIAPRGSVLVRACGASGVIATTQEAYGWCRERRPA